jgi:hypothetical protein
MALSHNRVLPRINGHCAFRMKIGKRLLVRGPRAFLIAPARSAALALPASQTSGRLEVTSGVPIFRNTAGFSEKLLHCDFKSA